MSKIKQKIATVSALTMLATPAITPVFLYAPSVLAEEVVSETSVEEVPVTEEVTQATEEAPSEDNTADSEAEESSSSQTIEELIASETSTLTSNAVFQISIGYEFEDGSYDEWGKGTGFLINDRELLTAQFLADNSTNNSLYKSTAEKKADAYKRAGIDLRNESLVEKNLVIRVKNLDGEEYKVSNTNVKNGLGFITLDRIVPYSPVVFEELEDVVKEPDTTYNAKVAIVNDNAVDVVELEATVIEPPTNATVGTMTLTTDSSYSEIVGSPVYGANGLVVGMVTGNNGNNLTVVEGEGLQNFLNSFSVDFKTRTMAEKEEAESDSFLDENEYIEEVDASALKKAVKSAKALKESDYTKSTYSALTKAIKAANKVLKDENHSQAEVDSALSKLTEAQDNLETIPFINKYFLPIVGGGAGLLAVIIAVTIGKAKKVKAKAMPQQRTVQQTAYDDLEELRRMEQADLGNYEEAPVQQQQPQYADDDYLTDVTPQVTPANLRTAQRDKYAIEFADESPDKVVMLTPESKFGVAMGGGRPGLRDEGDDETTILGQSAYLVRRDDNSEIPIRDGFVIGKQLKEVNYCITGNPSVSRTHAHFRIVDNDYCIEDLQSKNFTYLNGSQLPAYKPAKLSDGDVIKLADVEFVFRSGNRSFGR